MGGALAVRPALGLRFGSTIHVWVADESWRTPADRHVVMWTAFSAARAGIVVDARVDTLGVLALLVRRTVAVAATPDHVAAFVRVAAVSTAATALGLIPSHVAFAVLAARVGDEARVDAHAVDARLVHVALSVRATADGATSGLRVALVARLATAHRTMVVDVALGVQSAVAWVAALAVNAGLRARAFRVAFTAWLTLQHDLTALAVHVGHPQFGTLADHCAHGHTVQHGTLGRRIARLQFHARVLAASVDAGQAVGTVGIGRTLGLVRNWWATFTI